MDTTQQAKLAETIIKHAHKETLTANKVKEANPSVVEKILEQRHNQRDILFNLSINLAKSSFLFIVGTIFSYIMAKLILNIDLFPDYMLQVLSVVVFGQIVGIIGIIARSIWDDKPYHDHLGMDYLDKHRDT